MLKNYGLVKDNKVINTITAEEEFMNGYMIQLESDGVEVIAMDNFINLGFGDTLTSEIRTLKEEEFSLHTQILNNGDVEELKLELASIRSALKEKGFRQ